MSRLYATLVLLGVLLVAGRAQAQTCSFVTVVGVNFGAYTGGPLDSAGSVTYTCSGLAGGITIDISRGVALQFLPRRLFDGGHHLDYNLYLDAGVSIVWGDGTAGTSHYIQNSPPNGTNETVNIFGRVAAGQNVQAGSYFDTLAITINY